MASYKEWINLTDIDYYTAYLKSWIAFNSWYKIRPEYESFIQDRQIIDEIKDKSDSLIKKHIINFLNGNDFESNSFKQDIGNLHMSLGQAAIYINNRNRPVEPINFEKIATLNQTKSSNETIKGIQYIFDRIKNGQIKSEIKTTSNPPIRLFYLEQDEYNELALETSSAFMSLPDDQQQSCSAIYKNINPYTYYSIIAKNRTEKSKKFKLGNVEFINDTEKISIAVIEILFMLRNALVHGNVEPNSDNIKVYKFAYSLLYAVLQKLR